MRYFQLFSGEEQAAEISHFGGGQVSGHGYIVMSRHAFWAL
jgi:hypothetical protein